jgi:hypothetical protein
LELEEKAEDWLHSNYPSYMPSYALYRTKHVKSFPTYFFDATYVNELTAWKWWQMVQIRNEKSNLLDAGFIDLIKNLHSCPASSGSLERFFSTYGLVWNKIRNKLGKEKAEKLVRAYRFLRHNV